MRGKRRHIKKACKRAEAQWFKVFRHCLAAHGPSCRDPDCKKRRKEASAHLAKAEHLYIYHCRPGAGFRRRYARAICRLEARHKSGFRNPDVEALPGGRYRYSWPGKKGIRYRYTFTKEELLKD